MHSIFLWALIHFAPSIHWTYVTRIWGKWVSSPKIPAPMPVTFLVFFAPTYKAVAFRWYQLNYNLQVQIPHDCFEAKCVCAVIQNLVYYIVDSPIPILYHLLVVHLLSFKVINV